MKFVTYSAFYKRERLNELYCKHYNRLGIPVYGVVSTSKDETILRNNGIDYVIMPNLPVGRKLNAGLKQLQDVDFDYMVLLSSDDFVADNFFEVLENTLTKDVAFFNDIWFLDPFKKENGYWKVSNKGLIGAGACISKKVLDKLDYDLWDDDLNRNLDCSMMKKLNSFDIQKLSCIDLGIEMVDVKYSHNITSTDIMRVMNKKKPLKNIDVEQFYNLPRTNAERQIKFNIKPKKTNGMVKIEIKKDYLDLKKGQKVEMLGMYAKRLIAKGIAQRYATIIKVKEVKAKKPKKITSKAQKSATNNKSK